MNKKFYCYSIQLKNFLKLQGINYLYCSRHYKTGNHFWVYDSSLALDRGLANWAAYKKMFKKGEKK